MEKRWAAALNPFWSYSIHTYGRFPVGRPSFYFGERRGTGHHKWHD
jgi:hypothetical protein